MYHRLRLPLGAAPGWHSPWRAGTCGASSKPSHSCPVPTDAAGATRRGHACPWSSDTPPRTRRSEGSSSGARSSRPSPKSDADNRHTARVEPNQSCTPDGGRNADRRSHPAICTCPDTPGKVFSRELSLELLQGSLATTVRARSHTTGWGLLSQPDKQKTPRKSVAVDVRLIRRQLERVVSSSSF